MPPDRALSMVSHSEQWWHCAHHGTALLPEGGVQLTWSESPGTGADMGTDMCSSGAASACRRPGEPGGLVFDPWCVGYRSDPAAGAVAAVRPGVNGRLRSSGVYSRPRGLAVDARQRLYVADSGSRAVVVVDLGQGRIIRRVSLAPARPVDVVSHCGRVLTLTVAPAELHWLEGRRAARPGPPLIQPRCPPRLQPVRLTSGPLVLWTAGSESVVARPDGTVELELGPTSDLDVAPDGTLVVARLPEMTFQRFRPGEQGWVELEPVGAPGYDGGAVAHTPAGRIAYTTAEGIATTTGSRTSHTTTGSVTSYRLDSGSYRTRWGRVFLEACLPPRTEVRLQFVSTDEDTVADPMDPSPPDRPRRPGTTVPRPVDYPPLPSSSAGHLDDPGGAVFRRPDGAPYTWRTTDDSFSTYEAPVSAAQGRYLWFRLHLRGTDQITPRVRSLRIERPGHGLLGSLPLNWSRNEDDAEFLQRYLAPPAGVLDGLDWLSAQRAVLLDPRATPPEKLDWLAGFAGLVLDRRWPEAARRSLVAEAYRLFARRGTSAALVRLLEIYLSRRPTLIEQWQLRGLGGAVLGTEPSGPVAPYVGGAARETGSLGRFTVGGRQADSDSYEESAHRCTVLVQGTLTEEQRSVVHALLEMHRPAHVVIDLCELGDGMRVGQQLRVALSSFVGPGAAWRSAIVGESGLGVDRIIGSGQAAGGLRVGDARVGERRVR